MFVTCSTVFFPVLVLLVMYTLPNITVLSPTLISNNGNYISVFMWYTTIVLLYK